MSPLVCQRRCCWLEILVLINKWRNLVHILVPIYNSQLAFVVPIYYFCWTNYHGLVSKYISPVVWCLKYDWVFQWVNPTCNFSLLYKIRYLQFTLSMVYPFILGVKLSLYLFEHPILGNYWVLPGGLTLQVFSATRDILFWGDSRTESVMILCI